MLFYWAHIGYRESRIWVHQIHMGFVTDSDASDSVTLSRKIRLFTVEFLPSRTAARLTDYLCEVSKLYAHGGFRVRTILMDQEFDKVKDKMPSLEVNTTHFCNCGGIQ